MAWNPEPQPRSIKLQNPDPEAESLCGQDGAVRVYDRFLVARAKGQGLHFQIDGQSHRLLPDTFGCGVQGLREGPK